MSLEWVRDDQGVGGWVPRSGGGGSLPAEMTGPGALEVASTDATGDDILRIQAPVGYHQTSGDGYVLRAFAGDGTNILNYDPSGALNLQAADEEGTQATLLINGTSLGDETILRAAPAFGLDRISVIASARLIFRVLEGGAIYTGANSAPVDADLQPGTVAIWFDQTNGAAKLKAKGKTADGTVVAGELALT